MYLTTYPRYVLQCVGVLLSFLCHAAVAQVCATPGNDAATSSIAGIVNTYYPGTGAAVPPGATSIAVGALDTAGGTVGSYRNGASSPTAGAYRYQVVRVPQYAVVTLTANVVPPAWNGAAVCPAAAQWPNLLSPAGLALPTLPALGCVSFVLACDVTATGQ